MTASSLIVIHIVATASPSVCIVEVWSAPGASEIALVVIASTIGVVIVVAISISHVLLATSLIVIVVIVVVIHVTTSSIVLVHIVGVLVIVAT